MRRGYDVSPTAQSPHAPVLVGSSRAFQRVVALAARAAAGGTKVLITGESGSGKDVLARFIHANSVRGRAPFVALNCAGIAESLLESELFGHVRGSFTGAYRDKIGSLELANRGTIFLDEIGDMGQRMQGLVLQFLDSGLLRRVGSDAAPTHVDVRIVSATHRDLHAMVSDGAFREDLFYRINGVHIHVPPLRERVDDIRLLARHVVAKCGASLEFREDAWRLLEAYSWPGNIRELQNVVEQLTWLVSGGLVTPEDLPLQIHAGGPGWPDQRPERRRSLCDDLYEGVTTGRVRFWDDVYPLFRHRDITRADLRKLIGRGLTASSGSYRGLLKLFGLPQEDYKRLLNFLAAHDCTVNSREFRASSSRDEPGAIMKRPTRPAV